MHLLATTVTTLDEIVEPVDLGQTPGDVVVLSFADSDLAGLAAAWALERDALPSVRLASLRDLRHPMSVDIWIDRVGVHAKVILVRLLGGLDWWRYGIERLSALARESGTALAILPGEDRDDPRLAGASTLPAHELDALLQFFREGGCENLRALLRRLAGHAGAPAETEPRPVPRLAGYLPGVGAVDVETLAAQLPTGRPVIAIIFYRALLLAADASTIDALCEALAARSLAPAPLVVASLKDTEAAEFIRSALARLSPAVVVTTTAFAAGGEPGQPTPLDAANVPVLQAVIANTKRSAWRDSARGLGAADLAMHVVLPELDGRVLAGAIAFKEPLAPQEALAFTALVNHPEPDRIAFAADRISALAHLQATPRAQRRLAILLPDYPAAAGRAGYAVGLDVPASVLALLADLRAAGYTINDWPQTSCALLDALRERSADASMALETYEHLLAQLTDDVTQRIADAWGAPAADPELCDGAFQFRARAFGNVLVAFPPDRGRSSERRAEYHDPKLPPRHALLAFGLWLQHVVKVDALVHMGAHGTLEWLPGKAVALTSSCFPEAVVGPLPVIYPFIVSNPGEAAHAKRRIAAVTIGHLPPPLVATDLSGAARELERLVDEYAQAEGLDRKRRERLARLIVETAQGSGLAREARVDAELAPDEALRRIDAWLCDIKDLAIKDGLHVYGRPPASDQIDPAWRESASAERSAAIAALDGRRIAPGPAGSPLRGRRNVLPTGRVTGVEVLPIAPVGRPRIDVTWRISGLFRDLFPAQIALIDAATKAVAARDESDDDNPLAAARRSTTEEGAALPRIFGNAPGAYGAGIEGLLGSDVDRESIGAAYLAAASHAYGGAEGGGKFSLGEFAARVARADLLLHSSDDPGRDLLEGAEDAAFVGGFAAAAASSGRAPDLIMLDLTDPRRPRVRPLDAALARIVRGRAVNPQFIAGLMRHGPRGAAELAETVDRLADFAQTTGAVASTLFDLVHEAYLADARVRDFLLRENPAAAQAIAERLDAARRNGLWHPRRNDIGTDLLTVAAEMAS